MNRTIKDATVKRYFYETHEQLRTHLRDFVDAYNFARRLKTLKGMTPYEFVCKAWTSSPNDSNSTRSTKCRDRTSRGPRASEVKFDHGCGLNNIFLINTIICLRQSPTLASAARGGGDGHDSVADVLTG